MTPGMYLPGFSEIIKAMIHKGSSNHIHFEEIIKYCKLPQDNFNEGKRIASLLVTVK